MRDDCSCQFDCAIPGTLQYWVPKRGLGLPEVCNSAGGHILYPVVVLLLRYLTVQREGCTVVSSETHTGCWGAQGSERFTCRE